MMTNKKLIFGVLIIVLVIVIVGLVMLNKPTTPPTSTSNTSPMQITPTTPPTIAPLSQNMSCDDMYTEIENNLDDANYCEKNSDCDVIMLGSVYIKFGCHHYININVDKEQIYQKMKVYDKKCRSMINRCAPAPDAQCVSGKCVSINK